MEDLMGRIVSGLTREELISLNKLITDLLAGTENHDASGDPSPPKIKPKINPPKIKPKIKPKIAPKIKPKIKP